MRERLPVTGLLVGASLANLPVVYVLVAGGDPMALLAGFVAMGLAWAGGFHVQGKRPGLVMALAGIGVVESVAVFVPAFAEVRPWLLLAAGLSLMALALAVRQRRMGR